MEILNMITLSPTTINDLAFLYEFQLDEEARHRAAFTPTDVPDKTAYINKHSKFLSDPSINNQTILVDAIIAGSIAKFMLFGDAEITYWIDRQFWGRGVAGKALDQFLKIENTRPLFGRVAFDNIGSQKVLEKCGFKKTGTDKGFAHARQEEVEEFIFRLD